LKKFSGEKRRWFSEVGGWWGVGATNVWSGALILAGILVVLVVGSSRWPVAGNRCAGGRLEGQPRLFGAFNQFGKERVRAGMTGAFGTFVHVQMAGPNWANFGLKFWIGSKFAAEGAVRQGDS